MKSTKLYLLLTSSFLLVSSCLLAGELDGLGDALFSMFFGFISFIVGTIFIFWFFRKDSTFILFTLSNLFLFFIVFFLVLACGDSDGFLNFLACIFYMQMIAQILAIIIAAIRKFKNIQAE